MVNILIVSSKGDIRINKAATATAEGLAKALRKAKAPVVIGTWLVEDGAVELTLWGWREAYAASVKSATFLFPAPHKKLTLFGDAIITATRDGKAVDISEDMWIAACAELDEMEDDIPVAAGGAGASAVSAVADDDEASEADSEAEAEADDDEDVDEFDDAVDDVEDIGDEEEEEEEDGEEDDDGDAGDEDEEEEEEEDGEDDCYDSDDGGGGGKRRAPRRRAMAAPEFRRMDMGLRARIKMPAPAGKRAPKWQTAPELEPE